MVATPTSLTPTGLPICAVFYSRSETIEAVSARMAFASA
jgi:hypothetical protein